MQKRPTEGEGPRREGIRPRPARPSSPGRREPPRILGRPAFVPRKNRRRGGGAPADEEGIRPRPAEGPPAKTRPRKTVIHDDCADRIGHRAGDGSKEFLPYQLDGGVAARRGDNG
jgi:hypothetical protein